MRHIAGACRGGDHGQRDGQLGPEGLVGELRQLRRPVRSRRRHHVGRQLIQHRDRQLQRHVDGGAARRGRGGDVPRSPPGGVAGTVRDALYARDDAASWRARARRTTTCSTWRTSRPRPRRPAPWRRPSPGLRARARPSPDRRAAGRAPHRAVGAQWQRCDSGGGNCADVPGATGSQYVLTATDVGHTIRLLERATNDFGSATAALGTDGGGRDAAGELRVSDALGGGVPGRPAGYDHERIVDRHGADRLRLPVVPVQPRRCRVQRDPGRDRPALRARQGRGGRDRPLTGGGVELGGEDLGGFGLPVPSCPIRPRSSRSNCRRSRDWGAVFLCASSSRTPTNSRSRSCCRDAAPSASTSPAARRQPWASSDGTWVAAAPSIRAYRIERSFRRAMREGGKPQKLKLRVVALGKDGKRVRETRTFELRL